MVTIASKRSIATLPQGWLIPWPPCATKALASGVDVDRERDEFVGARASPVGGLKSMPQGATPDLAARPEAAVTTALGRRSIVLVGMMGSGKSSIGRRVALRLGIPFVDADAEIEQAAGMSISDIFAVRGQAELRRG